MAPSSLDYPAERTDRSGPPPTTQASFETQGAGDIAAVRRRVFPFWLSVTGTGHRSTISLGPLRPLMLVQDLEFVFAGIADPPPSAIVLGWSQNELTESAVTLATPEAFQRLTGFTQAGNATAVGAAAQGFTIWNAIGDKRPVLKRINLPILQGEGYLTVSLTTTANQRVVGWVGILEAIPPDRLADFL